MEGIKKTLISVSMSVNDKEKLKELAIMHETSASALISSWIKEKYEEEIQSKKQ